MSVPELVRELSRLPIGPKRQRLQTLIGAQSDPQSETHKDELAWRAKLLTALREAKVWPPLE